MQKCDGRQTAVVMRIGSAERVVVGYARIEDDPDLGRVLRISIEDVQGEHDLFIAESQWNGSIVDGADYGCEFCLIPQSSPVV